MNDPWWQWLFFLPGNAFIARFGATDVGVWLGLAHASPGSTTSACVSAVLWLAALGAAMYLPGLLMDAADPTYRQQRRERRQAQKRMARQPRATGKRPPR